MGHTIENKRELLYHLLGVIAFLSFPIFFSPDFFTPRELIGIKGFRIDFLFHLLLIIYFYFSYFVLLKSAFFKEKYILYFISITLIFLVLIYISDFLGDFIKFKELEYRPIHEDIGHPRPRPHNDHHFRRIHFFELGKHFLQFLMVTILGILMIVNKRRKDLEQEKKNLELNYLKSKLNPHFLFNTLNGIYALALEKSDRAAEAVVKLSGLMRYILTEAEKDDVLLINEIKYIEDYVELQKMRMDKNNHLKFAVIGSPSGNKITPMILMTFIENAFKYGVNPDRETRIEILLEIEGTGIKLSVLNTKSVEYKQEENLSAGHGLSNTKFILENKYPGNYKLDTIEEATTYQIQLYINLEN